MFDVWVVAPPERRRSLCLGCAEPPVNGRKPTPPAPPVGGRDATIGNTPGTPVHSLAGGGPEEKRPRTRFSRLQSPTARITLHECRRPSPCPVGQRVGGLDMRSETLARHRRRFGVVLLVAVVLGLAWLLAPGLPVLWGPYASASVKAEG